MVKKKLCKNCKINELKGKQSKFCSRSCTTTYRNKTNNPMKNKDTVKKMIKKKKGCLVWNKGLTKNDHPSIMKHSDDLRINNPMFNEGSRKKSSMKLKQYYKDESPEKKEERINKIKKFFSSNISNSIKDKQSKVMKRRIKNKEMWWQSNDKEYKEKIGKKLGESVSKWRREHPEEVKKAGKKLVEFYRKNPEKHPLRKIAGKNSFWQKRLYLLLCHFIPKNELEEEFFIKTKRSYRFADIAWKKNKIDFEYDGGIFHNKKDDNLRDKELKDVGWKTIRFNFKDFKDELFEEKIIKIIIENGI